MDISLRMHTDVDDLEDLELRLVDPAANRFRLYGVTECRTLFGELCLRIVWGRIGNRRLRERSEVFGDRASLARRRDELLGRRRRHGYVATSTPRAAARARAQERPEGVSGPRHPWHVLAERVLVEAHGMPIEDPTARSLVARWHAATLRIVQHLHAKGAGLLDLIDASTLASMFITASAA